MDATCIDCETLHPDDEWQECVCCGETLCLPCHNARETLCMKCFKEDLTPEELVEWEQDNERR